MGLFYDFAAGIKASVCFVLLFMNSKPIQVELYRLQVCALSLSLTSFELNDEVVVDLKISHDSKYQFTFRFCKRTIIAGFHFFFSFFTPNVNFSNTSVHVGAESHLNDESGQHMETP